MTKPKRKSSGKRRRTGARKRALVRATGLMRWLGGPHPRVAAPVGRAFAKLPLVWRLAIGLPLLGISLGSAAFAGLLLYYTIAIPDPLDLKSRDSAPVIQILARDGSVLAERGSAHAYLPIDLVPRSIVAAVLATEDRRFFDHWGVDPLGLARAAFVNLRQGRFAEGGSTLTQQLAKNLFLTSERSLSRKVEELVLAFWLELRLSKHEILELYLNRVYFGGGAYGVEAAAQRYFDKSARQLSIAEAAVIAGLLKAPSRYAPSSNSRLAVARARVVLAKMVAAGLISAREHQDAIETGIDFAPDVHQPDRGGVSYAVDFALEHLPPVISPGQSEIIVDTTLDRDLQAEAAKAVADEIAKAREPLAVGQAAVVVLDTDGGIRAMVGGRSFAESQFNRATKAYRQPGSAFKPFVYLTALENGFTPDSVAYDLPMTIGGWSPGNDSGKYAGPVALRQALAQSINTVAVRLVVETGPSKVARLAKRLGIDSTLREEASLALGTSEVSLLELTGAYGAFARGGRPVEPYVIRRIRSRAGRVLYARGAEPVSGRVAPATVGALNDMLADVVRAGTGRRAALDSRPVAGKTGTSQDHRDAWFIGFTAQMIGGVWVGNDNGEPMRNVTGGQIPAVIWRRIMAAAHEHEPVLPLPGVDAYRASEVAALRAVRTVETGAASHGPDPIRAELLPWQSAPSRQAKVREERAGPDAIQRPDMTGNRASAEREHVSAGRVSLHPPGPAYPDAPISADFIARSLEGL